MGSLCAGEEKMDDIVTSTLRQDGTAIEHRRTLAKESKAFVRKTKTMLSVIIPELKRILHHKEEADMLRQIATVLDKVALHYHEDFTPDERQRLLMLCVPENEDHFRLILETFKPGERIRKSRADVDLMRIIWLWFESDKDNSGELNMTEVGQLLNTLGIAINKRELKSLFDKVDTSGDGDVQFDEFYSLFTDVTTIPVVHEIFAKLSTRQPKAPPIFLDDGKQVFDFVIDPAAYKARPQMTAAEIAAAVDQSVNVGSKQAGAQDNALLNIGQSDFSNNNNNNNNKYDDGGSGTPKPALPLLAAESGAAGGATSSNNGNLNGNKTPPTGSPNKTPPPSTPSQAGLLSGQRTPPIGVSASLKTPGSAAVGVGDENQPPSPAAAGDAKEQAKLDKEAEKERKRKDKEEKKAAKKRKKDQDANLNPEAEVLSFHDCHRFLREVQQMEFEPDAAVFVVANFFGETRTIDGIAGVAPRQFQNALVDPVLNSWMNPKEELVTQDMSQPISHYFIDASFNTYLTGNQLSSPPSSEMFREALREGCRYIEMDVWNGPNNEPIVCLGPGAPRTITFEETVKAIAENAFFTTPYPVIVALEIHVDDAQQLVMSSHMKRHFGDQMVLAADMEKSMLSSPSFTPAKLLRRFLVKTKKMAELVIEQALDEEFIDSDKVAAMAARAQRGSSLAQVCAIEQRRFRSLGACKKWPHYALVSFDETKVEQLFDKEIEDVAEISKTMFIRSYPKGLRYDSSNQNPMKSWAMGVQLVTMNYQTLDYGFRLNRAKFSMNGHCGYVLKPRCLRLPGVTPNLYGDRMKLTVEIVCGVQLPRSLKVKKGETEIPDPFVQLWITGVPQDDTSATVCDTDYVENNTFNPRWGETFTFVIQSVDMAILTVRVMDRDIGAIIAEGVCPVAGLRMGYRAIPLVAENGVAIPPPSCLFARFEIAEIGRRIDQDDL